MTFWIVEGCVIARGAYAYSTTMTLTINMPITRQVIGGGAHVSSASQGFEGAPRRESPYSLRQAGIQPSLGVQTWVILVIPGVD